MGLLDRGPLVEGLNGLLLYNAIGEIKLIKITDQLLRRSILADTGLDTPVKSRFGALM
jgi:hypothetical protein